MSDWDLILAVDIGTSAARAVLFDSMANPVSTARKSYHLLFPKQGWSEQNPDDIADAAVEVLREAVSSIPSDTRLAGVVFSAQMYSILAVDREGRPVSNSLTWGDMRSADLAARTRSRLAGSSSLVKRTGCPVQAIYPFSKIQWMKENLDLPGDTRFVSIKDYVLFRLTGRLISDWSIASASGMLNIVRYQWDAEAMSLCQITEHNLPDLVSPRQIIRQWRPDICEYTGIPQGTAIVIGAGDAPLANIGVGAITANTLAVNVGTSAAARVLISEPQTDTRGRLWTYVADEGKWVIGGIIGSGGAVYDWLLRKLIFSDTAVELEALYEEADRLSASVEPGAEDLLFIPYFTGEHTPNWNANAKGFIYGMTFAHEKQHYVRAALEGLTFALLRVARTIEEVRNEPTKEIRITGGLAASREWIKIITNVFGAPVNIPSSTESSARGAAILGWLALGRANTYEDFFAQSTETEYSSPDNEIHESYQLKFHEFCALNDRLNTDQTSKETTK